MCTGVRFVATHRQFFYSSPSHSASEFFLVHRGEYVLKKGMWMPPSDVSEDRFHQIYYRCKHCKPLKKACQYFGHVSEMVCEEPQLKTVNDIPVCEDRNCPNQDFMLATHNLCQTFYDEEWNWFNVFFTDVEQVNLFFRHFPANRCLQDDKTWCQFVAIVQHHKSLEAFKILKMIELTLKVEKLKNGVERLVYVSGFLQNSLEF